MEIKPYKGKYTPIARALYEDRLLTTLPIQVVREDLEYDAGIDIIFRFKNMTPAKFAETSDAILLAAFSEAERYQDEKYKFAKIEVELNRTAKGRKTLNPRRSYIAAKHTDPEVMVYGEEALGYTIPEGAKKPFLINKIEEILGIPESPSPGAYVKKQRPYRVLSLVVSIRAGRREEERRIEKELKKSGMSERGSK